MRQALSAAAKVQEAGVALQARAGDVTSKLRGRADSKPTKRNSVALNASGAEDLHRTIEGLAKSLQAGTAEVDKDWIVNIVEKHQQCMMCCSKAGLEDNAFGTTDFVMYVLQHPQVEAILGGAQVDNGKVKGEDEVHPIIRRLSTAQAVSDSPAKRRESLKEAIVFAGLDESLLQQAADADEESEHSDSESEKTKSEAEEGPQSGEANTQDKSEDVATAEVTSDVASTRLSGDAVVDARVDEILNDTGGKGGTAACENGTDSSGGKSQATGSTGASNVAPAAPFDPPPRVDGALHAEEVSRQEPTDKSPVVIGITGCTRSGKGWTAKSICSRLGLHAQAIVGQDSFWCRAVSVQTPSGQKMHSEEEPDCTDHDAFAKSIRGAVAAAVTPVEGFSRPCVIVEGFQLVHDASVVELLNHIFFLELGRDECIARRSAPRGPLNTNPLSVENCEQLVWPAHERYVRDKIKPLGERVRCFNSPASDAEVAVIVDAICSDVGFSANAASNGRGNAAATEDAVTQALPSTQAEHIAAPEDAKNVARGVADDSPKGDLAAKLAARRLRTDTSDSTAKAGAEELEGKLAARRERNDTGGSQTLSPRSQRLADAAAATLADGCGAADGRSMKDKLAARRRQLEGDTP